MLLPASRCRHVGIPSGQPYSTVIMSCPTRLRSSAESVILSQSRTGSPPPSVRKKIAGTRFAGFSGTIIVYHRWYDGGREYPTQPSCGELVRTDRACQAEVGLRSGVSVRALLRKPYGVTTAPEWDASSRAPGPPAGLSSCCVSVLGVGNGLAFRVIGFRKTFW